jgi:hypothetical protein
MEEEKGKRKKHLTKVKKEKKETCNKSMKERNL